MSVKVHKTIGGRTNMLHLKCDIDASNVVYTSACYICGVNNFEVKIEGIRRDMGNVHASPHGVCVIQASIYVRFSKLLIQDELTYICKVFKDEKDEISFAKDEIWHLLYSKDITKKYTFDLHVTIDVAPETIHFANLHEDTVLTDFKLQCVKGTVNVHKAVLASASPIFHNMLIGKWKETKESCVEIPVPTVIDLENFKKYIYLKNLPGNVNDLERLCELGCCYMMPDLLQRCTVKFINQLTEGNVFQVTELATKYKLKNLLLYIFKYVSSGSLVFHNITALAGWNNDLKTD